MNSTLVLLGPTASGKSDLAIRIAKRLDGEILCADSMQIYRGLDVGTAKPTLEQRREVPHHLVDLLDIREKLDVYRFIEMADRVRSSILERGKIPIVVGGSGYYLKSFLHGLDPLPGDPTLRAELDARYESPENHRELRERVKAEDPDAFERWHDNPRKLLRALEVRLLTGKSLTMLQTGTMRPMRFPATLFLPTWSRDELKSRIRERAVMMLDSGWIEETQSLLECGFEETPTARQALGYSVVADFLRGRIDRAGLEKEIIRRTWAYARRQMTWFRNQHPDARPIVMPIDDEMLDRILAPSR